MDDGALPPGMFRVGHKLYGVCADCERVIRVDKFLFGSLHVCLTGEELRRKRPLDAHRAGRAQRKND